MTTQIKTSKPVEEKKNKSSLHRLLNLPEIFSVKNFCKITKMDSHQASVYLSRWKKEGFIHEMGPRARVYLNLIKNPSLDENLFKAVEKIYPEFVFAGTAILRECDWITQINPQTEIVIWKKNSVAQLNDFTLMPRTKTWFVQFSDGILEKENGYRYLSPEYAFVDLCQSKDWQPDPDDLFMDENDRLKVKQAFAKLEVEIPEKLKTFLNHSSDADLLETAPNKLKV